MRIRILATGGTIDKVYFDAASAYEIGEPQVGPVLRESNVTFDFVVESVLQKDSLAMTDDDRALYRAAVDTVKSIRVSVGWNTTREDVERFSEAWIAMAREAKVCAA